MIDWAGAISTSAPRRDPAFLSRPRLAQGRRAILLLHQNHHRGRINLLGRRAVAQ
jgi:hypothetical protein